MNHWDEVFAKNLVGTTLLVGLTREHGEDSSDEQFFGVVTKCDPKKGITLRLEGSRGGSFYNLPPDTSSIYPAEPGEYRLHQTEEVVKNPDYISTWTIKEAPSSAPQ